MQGIHVVTPNKKLGSGPLAEYLAVKQLQRAGKAHLMYEVRPPAGRRYGAAVPLMSWVLLRPTAADLLPQQGLCCRSSGCAAAAAAVPPQQGSGCCCFAS